MIKGRKLKVFITGVSGFVGPHLLQELLQAGHEVWGVSRADKPGGAHKLFENHLFLELKNEPEIAEAIAHAEPDVIIHLAAQSNPALSWEMPLDTFDSNVGMTVSLLRGMQQRPGTRFYFISSSDVYGRPPEETLPVTEAHPLMPDNPYAVSKVAAEHCARLYGEKFGIQVGIIRPFSHTGPGQTSRFVVPAFARQIAEIEAGLREKLIHGDLSTFRDFTDVRDIVRAYRLIVEHESCLPVVNVCSGMTIEIQHILDQLISMSNTTIHAEFDRSKKRGEFRTPLRGTYKLLQCATGWQPILKMDETLQDVLQEQRKQVGALLAGGNTK
ncbi:MAG: GDP-mannose 4,6-dehydratase [Sumerlaeia bacterium]